MPLSDQSPDTSSTAGGSGGAGVAQGAAILGEGTAILGEGTGAAVFEKAATFSESTMPAVAPSAATDDFSGFSDSPPGIQASSKASVGMTDDAFGSFASNASIPSASQPGGAFGDFTTTAFDSTPQAGAAPSGATGDAFGDFAATAPPTTPAHEDAFFSGFDSAPSAGAIQATKPSAGMIDDAFDSFAPNSAPAVPLSAGDAFSDFAASSSIPGPVSAPPSGVGLLDVDFLGMGGSGSTASSSLALPAQFGMGDMLLASLDPLSDSAAPASSDLYGQWLARLPDLSFVLSNNLCRPPHGSVKV